MRVLYRGLSPDDRDAGLALVLEAYRKERERTAGLPPVDPCRLAGPIERLIDAGNGVAAVGDRALLGFMAAVRVPGMFGAVDGAYCPLFGHGMAEGVEGQVWQELYGRTADLWTRQGMYTHAITLFAGDRDLKDRLVYNGFGMRCADAIREVGTIERPRSDGSIRILESGPRFHERAAEIHRQHNGYYRQSPMFMPNADEDPMREQDEWNSGDNHHEWLAFRGEKPIGLMRLGPQGENFISRQPSVMNIKGAYVVEEERAGGVATLLLAAVDSWAKDHGYPLLGVDYETINPLGSRYWERYFTPYTYSLVRRIDERIAAYR